MAGFWGSLLGGRGGNTLAQVFTPRVTVMGAEDLRSLVDPSTLTASQMWKTQPHFRTVVSFLARNIAQLGLHSFERDGNDRRRDRDSVLARALADGDGLMSSYDLIYALVGDLALYDRAYWLVAQNPDRPSGWMLRRLPPTWVEPVWDDPWTLSGYRLYATSGRFVTLPASAVLAFPGYHPGRTNGNSPVVDALRETLMEQVEAAKYRGQVWKRGGRVSSVLERPKDAPGWSDAARSAFREDWYSKYTGEGSKAGGTPILEDGMTLKTVDFSAKDQQYVEAAKLSLQTVAGAFHVNPTMIGMNDGATYSNVREFRKMLYGDTLGPIMAQIEGRINTFLFTLMGLDNSVRYVEFNIDEKLQGNFEEQSTALQSATGGPWMTRNEARAVRNLPAVEGGDELIVPLNVLIGGQASPQDSGKQNQRSARPRVKASDSSEADGAPATDHRTAAKEAMTAYFRKQRQVVSSRLGAKSVKADPSWWDAARWNKDLRGVLMDLSVSESQDVARAAMKDLGFDPDKYSVEQTEAWLSKKATALAEQINDTTMNALYDAVDDDSDTSVSDVFDDAEENRSDSVASTFVTAIAGFATLEGARQGGGGSASKRWQVNSANPRASHAAMDGETVGLDDEFSNGLKYPGAFSSDADEVAGCTCSVVVVTD